MSVLTGEEELALLEKHITCLSQLSTWKLYKSGCFDVKKEYRVRLTPNGGYCSVEQVTHQALFFGLSVAQHCYACVTYDNPNKFHFRNKGSAGERFGKIEYSVYAIEECGGTVDDIIIFPGKLIGGNENNVENNINIEDFKNDENCEENEKKDENININVDEDVKNQGSNEVIVYISNDGIPNPFDTPPENQTVSDVYIEGSEDNKYGLTMKETKILQIQEQNERIIRDEPEYYASKDHEPTIKEIISVYETRDDQETPSLIKLPAGHFKWDDIPGGSENQWDLLFTGNETEKWNLETNNESVIPKTKIFERDLKFWGLPSNQYKVFDKEEKSGKTILQGTYSTYEEAVNSAKGLVNNDNANVQYFLNKAADFAKAQDLINK